MFNRFGIAKFALAFSFCLPLLWACSDDERSFLSEGSQATPVELGAVPVMYSGTVSGAGESYYRTSAAEGNWEFVISNIDGDPDLWVYGDSTFLDVLCNSGNNGTAPESCNLECVTGCDFFIRVVGVSARGASYNLSVSPFVP